MITSNCSNPSTSCTRLGKGWKLCEEFEFSFNSCSSIISQCLFTHGVCMIQWQFPVFLHSQRAANSSFYSFTLYLHSFPFGIKALFLVGYVLNVERFPKICILYIIHIFENIKLPHLTSQHSKLESSIVFNNIFHLLKSIFNWFESSTLSCLLVHVENLWELFVEWNSTSSWSGMSTHGTCWRKEKKYFLSKWIFLF